MTNEEYKHVEDTLRQLSLYIFQCREREINSNPKRFIQTTKEKQIPTNLEDYEVSQLNKIREDKGVFQFFTKKEIEKMPKLKDLTN